MVAAPQKFQHDGLLGERAFHVQVTAADSSTSNWSWYICSKDKGSEQLCQITPVQRANERPELEAAYSTTVSPGPGIIRAR